MGPYYLAACAVRQLIWVLSGQAWLDLKANQVLVSEIIKRNHDQEIQTMSTLRADLDALIASTTAEANSFADIEAQTDTVLTGLEKKLADLQSKYDAEDFSAEIAGIQALKDSITKTHAAISASDAAAQAVLTPPAPEPVAPPAPPADPAPPATPAA